MGSLTRLLIHASTLWILSFFYIRRYYPPTMRAYFVPTKGININRLGIHIRGPPARIPHENPPPYMYATEFGYGRRRRRRGRQTVGDTVGEGGARIGERDEDDMFDGDLTAERASISGGTAPVAREPLPRYYVDAGLPMYEIGDGSAAEEAERIRAEAAVAGAEGDEVDALPTAAEYEAASRAARNNATTGAAGGEGAEGGTGEEAEQRDPRDEAVEGTALYPPRPPPVARSTTGRSSLLAAFSRNRAPSPERSHPHGQRPPLTSRTTTNGIDEDDFGSSSESTSTVSTTIDALPTMRRTMSLESGATGSTTDADPLGSKSRVKKIQPGRPGLAEASSSSVKIDPELQHKEEATAEAPASGKDEEPADAADQPSSEHARDRDARRDEGDPDSRPA